LFSLSGKFAPTIAPFVRVGIIYNDAPAIAPRASAISNPIVGVVWGVPGVATHWKVAALTAISIPIGSGGGNDGDKARLAAEKAAVFVRSAMDNSAFAVNDLTPIIGLDVAYARGGFTLQGEATLFQLFRVRGEAVQPDVYKTNFTTGVHAGYYVLRWLCASAELRYQRYLVAPASVATNPLTVDNLTAGGGMRFDIRLGGRRVLRPGVSYSRGLDDPMKSRNYQIVQLDLPFVF
jgi:hypothetical protein